MSNEDVIKLGRGMAEAERDEAMNRLTEACVILRLMENTEGNDSVEPVHMEEGAEIVRHMLESLRNDLDRANLADARARLDTPENGKEAQLVARVAEILEGAETTSTEGEPTTQDTHAITGLTSERVRYMRGLHVSIMRLCTIFHRLEDAYLKGRMDADLDLYSMLIEKGREALDVAFHIVEEQDTFKPELMAPMEGSPKLSYETFQDVYRGIVKEMDHGRAAKEHAA